MGQVYKYTYKVPRRQQISMGINHKLMYTNFKSLNSVNVIPKKQKSDQFAFCLTCFYLFFVV